MTRSDAHRPRSFACVLAGVLALVAACAVVGPGSPPAGSLQSGVPTTPTATRATAAPSVARNQTVPPSPSPSPTRVPPPSASPPSVPTAATPPEASLSAEGGDPVVGQLGSYVWGGGGSDSPWLPGAPIAVGAREPLAVTFAGGPPVARWSARRARAGATSPIGAVPAGGGPGPIAVDAPASGSWTLAVTVEFAGGIGSATWYWRLDVR